MYVTYCIDLIHTDRILLRRTTNYHKCLNNSTTLTDISFVLSMACLT